jgi:protein SCO1/2
MNPATPPFSPRRHGGTEIACSQIASVSPCLRGEKGGWVVVVFALMLAFLGTTALADMQPDMGQPASVQPEALRGVGIDQRLDQAVPLDLVFRDETGAAVTLGSLLRGKPVILNLVYYECPMLCTLVLNGLLGAMKALPFDAGNEFDVITLSFDPTETPELAARKKATYLAQYQRAGAADGWHFLTGDAAAIERLAATVGFRYRYDAERKQFAHAAGLTVLTPRGIIARYLFGVEFAPRDLKFALMEAAENRIGSPIDQLLLFCYHYDPATGRYSSAVLTAVRAAGLVTVLGLLGFVAWAVRRERTGAVREEGGERTTRNAERRAAGAPFHR